MAIKVTDLDQAIAEATRFLSAAKALKEKADTFPPGPVPPPRYYSGGMLPAYVKRASLELTRALAQIRKP